MYVCPYLDPTDVNNQKFVKENFLSQQHKANGCPSFKAFAQRFSIKLSLQRCKVVLPFDCKQSPQQLIFADKGDKIQ